LSCWQVADLDLADGGLFLLTYGIAAFLYDDEVSTEDWVVCAWCVPLTARAKSGRFPQGLCTTVAIIVVPDHASQQVQGFAVLWLSGDNALRLRSQEELNNEGKLVPTNVRCCHALFRSPWLSN
jgi:hypothetical protein